MAVEHTTVEAQAGIDRRSQSGSAGMVGDEMDLPSRPVFEPHSYPDRMLSDRHVFHQLLLGLDGHVELDVEGRGLRVSPGVLMPVASGEHHHYLAPGVNRVLVLDLPENWCESLSLDWLFVAGGQGWRLPSAMRNRVMHLAASPEALVDWLCGLSKPMRRIFPGCFASIITKARGIGVTDRQGVRFRQVSRLTGRHASPYRKGVCSASPAMPVWSQ